MSTETTTTSSHGTVIEAHDDEHHPSDAAYFKVFAFLFVVTAAEVATYYVDMSTGALLAILVPMMVVKFAVVAAWFMHLKFDNKLLRTVFTSGLILAIIVYIIALCTFQFFA